MPKHGGGLGTSGTRTPPPEAQAWAAPEGYPGTEPLRLLLLAAALCGLLAAPSRPSSDPSWDFDQARLPVVQFPKLRGAAPRPRPGPPPGPAHALGDSKLRVLVGGEEFVAASREAIASAAESIELEMFQFANETLIEALEAKTRDGVKVRLLISPIPGRFQRKVLGRLSRAGAEVAFYPIGRLGGNFYRIDHAKLLIVDARRAVMGGSNWKPDPARNHDFNLDLEGGIVGRLRALFEDSWALARGARPPPGPPASDDPIRILENGPERREALEAVLERTATARTSIVGEQLQLSEPRIIAALAEAAGRGVKVRLLLDGKGFFIGGTNEAAAARLRGPGVEVRLFDSGRRRLHAKLAVFDGELVYLGSANWSRNAMQASHEVALLIRDADLAAELTARIEDDWSDLSREPSKRHSALIDLIGWVLDRRTARD